MIFFKNITNEKIKYTMERSAKRQPFLDLMIEIDPETNNFETKTYWKETASGAFLHPKSIHPRHTIKSIPHSELLMISRNASSIERYWEGAVRLWRELKRLTYSFNWITKAMDAEAEQHENLKEDDAHKSIKLIETYNDASRYQIDKKQLDLFTVELNKFYKTTLIHPIKTMNVKRVGKSLGTHFTTIIKHPEPLTDDTLSFTL